MVQHFTPILSPIFIPPQVFRSQLSVSNSSDEYLYTISMNPEAGNEFQETSTKFDLLINFSAGSPDNNSQTSGGTSSNNSTPPVL